jgi:hypothetical protein
MTLEAIRNEIILKTERKIQEMQNRSLNIPKGPVAMCQLCDQLSQEIYDFAVDQAIKTADRTHSRYSAATLLGFLEADLFALTNGAIDILLAGHAINSPRFAPVGSLVHSGSRPVFANPGRIFSLRPIQMLFDWVKGWRLTRQLG